MSIQQALAASYPVGGGGGGGPDLPNTLSLWARYKGSSVVAADGARLSQWNDTSGNGRHATQANVGNRPGFATAASGLIGNTNALVFNGGGSDTTKDYFLLPSMAGLSAGEIFFFLKVNNPGTHNRLHMMGSAYDSYYPYPGLGIYDAFGVGTRVNSIAGTIPSTWHMINIWSAVNNWGFSVNGVNYRTVTSSTPSFNANPRLGADYDGSAYKGDIGGLLAECVICSSICTSGERADVKTYFEQEYLGM